MQELNGEAWQSGPRGAFGRFGLVVAPLSFRGFASAKSPEAMNTTVIEKRSQTGALMSDCSVHGFRARALRPAPE